MRATVLIAVAATVILHFLWEMLQAPAFIPFAATIWAGTVRCLQAAFGDLLLAAGAYAITAALFWCPAWLFESRLRRVPVATWIALGVVTTAVLERYALDTGRWRYGPSMPTLAGVGMLPLLQWLVVPALTLMLVRSMVRR